MTTLQPGHLVMVDIEGKALSAETATFLREHHIRAVCLFRKNLGTENEVRQLVSDLGEVLGPQALIGIDQEGGSVARATFLPQAPAAMALGAIDDTAQAEAAAESIGAAVARGLRGLGINWNFAPVLDVNNNPANPVIAERSFGADPRRVGRLAGAWMRGSLAEGVACCVKHFPGHGDTHVDSHHALPTVDKSLAELEALELIPFRALKDEAPALMTAHIVYPQLDAEHPATLSRRVLTGLLRDAIGYRGVVISDALMMKAIFDRYGHARGAVLTLAAGADMALAQGRPEDQRAAIEAVGTALRDGRLDPAAMQVSRLRLDALARRFPAGAVPYAEITRADDDTLMRAAWARGLCTFGRATPPGTDTPLRVITQDRVDTDGVSEAGLAADGVAALFAGHTDVELLRVADLPNLDPATLPQDGRQTVLASNHRKRYGAAMIGWQPDLHLSLWNPFQVADIAAPAVVTWGYADGALAALRAWLEGRAPANGVAPVALAPHA
ncbi:MAG TPA: beta-N-acetylhexosaminidase [Ideonella sp.]|uniref:beta-N-acetylhexosaminidase n=1 Tax=Ideonella sp. TaxID=1929293 RepID=UPI002E3536EB|nr:beta-N-acetylhexosaminidase [Ideonella sp.]HEX5685415.1 beta-N-acetylhexosaminidase [Ideonella sp.]